MDNPNVEKIVIAWLNTVAGEDWPASGSKPKQPPASYILVDRTSGGREAMVLDAAEILIEVYHKSSQEQASDKANEIADLIVGLKNYESITRAKVNSVVRLDDLLGQYFRYQIYCDVFNRR